MKSLVMFLSTEVLIWVLGLAILFSDKITYFEWVIGANCIILGVAGVIGLVWGLSRVVDKAFNFIDKRF